MATDPPDPPRSAPPVAALPRTRHGMHGGVALLDVALGLAPRESRTPAPEASSDVEDPFDELGKLAIGRRFVRSLFFPDGRARSAGVPSVRVIYATPGHRSGEAQRAEAMLDEAIAECRPPRLEDLGLRPSSEPDSDLEGEAWRLARAVRAAVFAWACALMGYPRRGESGSPEAMGAERGEADARAIRQRFGLSLAAYRDAARGHFDLIFREGAALRGAELLALMQRGARERSASRVAENVFDDGAHAAWRLEAVVWAGLEGGTTGDAG